VPIQAGNDEVLEAMKRGYTREQYRALIQRVRDIIPDAAIHCDIIVGFPGETAAQFQAPTTSWPSCGWTSCTWPAIARGPGTVSARRMADDVPDEDWPGR
jgi:tRNA-2-methylthio-N6-dimethylallyladenosine synthase